MGIDQPDPAAFYATDYGAVAARLVGNRLLVLWPSLKGQTILGLGHTGPYLDAWRADARCIAVAPPTLGRARWPTAGKNLTSAAADDLLPFADLSFDRVLLVHGLESAENAARLLREAWRVLRDDGRLMVRPPKCARSWINLSRSCRLIWL